MSRCPMLGALAPVAASWCIATVSLVRADAVVLTPHIRGHVSAEDKDLAVKIGKALYDRWKDRTRYDDRTLPMLGEILKCDTQRPGCLKRIATRLNINCIVSGELQSGPHRSMILQHYHRRKGQLVRIEELMPEDVGPGRFDAWIGYGIRRLQGEAVGSFKVTGCAGPAKIFVDGAPVLCGKPIYLPAGEYPLHIERDGKLEKKTIPILDGQRFEHRLSDPPPAVPPKEPTRPEPPVPEPSPRRFELSIDTSLLAGGSTSVQDVSFMGQLKDRHRIYGLELGAGFLRGSEQHHPDSTRVSGALKLGISTALEPRLAATVIWGIGLASSSSLQGVYFPFEASLELPGTIGPMVAARAAAGQGPKDGAWHLDSLEIKVGLKLQLRETERSSGHASLGLVLREAVDDRYIGISASCTFHGWSWR